MTAQVASAILAINGDSAMIMHDWTAKHWIISSVIILLAVGAFALSWS